MNSLYLAAHPLWPLTSGARLRDFQLAQQMANYAKLTFAEMCEGAHSSAPPRESCDFSRVTLHKERPYTPAKIVKGLAGPVPLTVLNCWSAQADVQLADLLRAGKFDTVQVEGVHLMKYLPTIQRAPGSPALVVDWHNIESELMWRFAEQNSNWAKKIAAKRTANLIERAEDKLLSACAIHTVSSERERQKLLARHPSANIQVIPNGVDTGFYAPEKMEDARLVRACSGARPTILFVGSMDYHANIDAVTWFSREIWPQISRDHPDLHFTIVGRDPVSEIRSLTSDRIHVTGTVDDVRPFYASAVAAVVPIRSGSGTRLKILEAMAAGVPVISTRMGVEGIEAEDNAHLLLADTGSDFAKAVSRIVTSSETRLRLSQSARGLVARVYDWSVIGKKLCSIHHGLMESRSVRSFSKAS